MPFCSLMISWCLPFHAVSHFLSFFSSPSLNNTIPPLSEIHFATLPIHHCAEPIYTIQPSAKGTRELKSNNFRTPRLHNNIIMYSFHPTQVNYDTIPDLRARNNAPSKIYHKSIALLLCTIQYTPPSPPLSLKRDSQTNHKISLATF